MSILFLAWIVTTQGVNLAFYLMLTRWSLDWRKALARYLVGYVLPFVAHLLWLGAKHWGGERGLEGVLPVSFLFGFTLWGVNTLAASRGVFGHRLFAVLVCGVHQISAFSLGFLAMRRLPPTALGEGLAITLMAGMGALLVLRVLPQILKMDDSAEWGALNLTAAMSFALLYATGFWPTYVAAGDGRDIAQFLIANVVAVVYFPVGLSFAEKNRETNLRRILVDNTRVMLADLRAACAAEEGARRIRHDLRHHVAMLRGLLQDGQAEPALRYLEHTVTHELLLPPSNASWCENALVNAILKLGAAQAQAKGLDFRAEARVSAALKIAEPDLVAILSNLIENAVNGAAGGAVRVWIAEDRGALRIGVSNRVPEGFRLEGGLPCARPGVGLLSIRAEVAKHHGLFDYVLDGAELTARVMILPLKAEGRDA